MSLHAASPRDHDNRGWARAGTLVLALVLIAPACPGGAPPRGGAGGAALGGSDGAGAAGSGGQGTGGRIATDSGTPGTGGGTGGSGGTQSGGSGGGSGAGGTGDAAAIPVDGPALDSPGRAADVVALDGASDRRAPDGADARVDDAAPARPLAELQDRFLALRFGMFLHFNMSTFARQPNVSVSGEHERGNEDPALFNPRALDIGQWADAAVAAGMKYMVLTVKHHGGFCLWDSALTSHDVASSTWKGGQGDVVREFVTVARERGLKVGLYYSIRDLHNGAAPSFIKGQLTELLTRYGPIDLLWFDGWGWNVGYTRVPYPDIRDHIKSLQPNCLVIENNHRERLENTEIVVWEQGPYGGPPAGNTIPSEVAGNIRADAVWFYHPMGNCTLKPLSTLLGDLTTFNGRRTNYLLDVTPDDRGLIPDCQVDLLRQIGASAGVMPPAAP